MNDGRKTGRQARDPLSPEMLAAILEGANPPADAWLVFLGHRQSPPGQDRLAAFAETFGIDAYTARQWLNSPVPRLLRRVAASGRAEQWVRYLADLRLSGFFVKETALAANRPTPVTVYTREGEALSFETPDGATHSLPASTLLCIAAGEIREEVFEEHTEKFGLMGELSRGRSRIRSSTRFLFDLHFRGHEGPFRFDQDTLLFSRIYPSGGGRASSVLVRSLLASIRESVPAVPVYTEFHFAEDSLGQACETLGKSSDLMRRWIFGGAGGHLSETETRLRATLPAFHLYSSLLAEETRRRSV